MGNAEYMGVHERRGKAAHRERVGKNNERRGKHNRRVAHERRVKHSRRKSFNDQVSSIRVSGQRRCYRTRHCKRVKSCRKIKKCHKARSCKRVCTKVGGHKSFNDQISSIRVYGKRSCRRHRVCRNHCYVVPDGSERRKKAGEKKVQERVAKNKEK